MEEKELFKLLKIYSEKFGKNIDKSKEDSIIKSIGFLRNKAKTLDDIYKNSQYILQENIQISKDDLKLLDEPSKKILNEFLTEFKKMQTINKESLEKLVNELIKKHKTNFKGIGQPLRISLVGSKYGPGIYDIILSLKKEVVVKRISKIN